MKNRLLIFVMLFSLFLMISTVSADELVSSGVGSDIEVQTEEEMVDNSAYEDVSADLNKESKDALAFLDIANESVDSYSSSSKVSANDQTGNNTSNNGNTSLKPSETPYKFNSTKNIVSRYGKKVKFSVKVLNKYKKAINHTLVTFKVSGKTYDAYTNSKGIASIYLNLNAGKYAIRYYANNISGKNTYTVRNYYKIRLYKWKSGANVLKNKRIKANVPKSALVRKIIRYAKKGTPVIKFKGGKGKVVFITAGCHGNELPSQIAAMRLIKYLQSHPIKGTVYVMPFMNPKGTAANVRDYKNVHLNKLANKKGTISYKTVRLIKKFKADAYGDFHSTRPGGAPGKNVAMGTYKPTKESSTLAIYISKKAKVSHIIYKKAGAEYPGALEDEVNLKGIPSVTCEVLSPHGKIKKGSVKKSLLMMKKLLRYASLL